MEFVFQPGLIGLSSQCHQCGGDVGNGCDGGNGGEDGGGNAMNTIGTAGDQTHPVRTTNKYFNPSQL